jgi:proline dehydrogenase
VLRSALIFLSENSLARRFSMHAPGARAVARRFVAGETIDEGIDASRALVRDGFLVTLDYLGESVQSRAEARAAADTYITAIQRIGADAELREHVNVSIKLTQMGQDIRTASAADAASAAGGTPAAGSDASAGGAPAVGSRAAAAGGAPAAGSTTSAAGSSAAAAEPSRAGTSASPTRTGQLEWPRPEHGVTPESDGGYDDAFLYDNVSRIVDAAREHDIFVRFDMEGTPHTQRTLDFVLSLWDAGYRNIGIVLQSYLRRSEHDVREANRLDMRVRLCKGAYKEPETYAFQERERVDASFIALMKLLLSDGRYPGIATHDEAMIDATKDYCRTNDLPSAGWEFQMLYGIRRDLQHQLIAEGYNLRVYVPFGEAWYPYLMRRMAERPQNLMFIVSSIWTELFRKVRPRA